MTPHDKYLAHIQEAIQAEMKRSMTKFPNWPTDPFHALAVLQEEVGELSKAVLQYTYEPNKGVHPSDIMEEAIQCGAMVLRFIQSLHRYEFQSSKQHRQE